MGKMKLGCADAANYLAKKLVENFDCFVMILKKAIIYQDINSSVISCRSIEAQ